MHPGKPYTPGQKADIILAQIWQELYGDEFEKGAAGEKGLMQLEAELYQVFFEFLEQEHHLTCTISEMSEIIQEAQKIAEKLKARAIENDSLQNETKAQKARKKLIERVKYIIETRTE